MSSKYDGKDDGKQLSDDGKEDTIYAQGEGKGSKDIDLPRIEITRLAVDCSRRPISDPIDLRITFDLDRFYNKIMTIV